MVVPSVKGSLQRAGIARSMYLFKIQNHPNIWLMLRSFSVHFVLHGFTIVPESHFLLLLESLTRIC